MPMVHVRVLVGMFKPIPSIGQASDTSDNSSFGISEYIIQFTDTSLMTASFG